MTREILRPPVLRTARLVLRPYGTADVDDVLRYATNPEWARYLPVPQPYERTHAEMFVAKQILADAETQCAWAMEHEGRVVGGIDLNLERGHGRAWLGYSLCPSKWNRGLMSEAGRMVLEFAFATHPWVHRVYAWADVRNVASTRVMEKLGMIREGVLRGHGVVRGENVDDVYYGILRSEFEA